MVLKFKNFLKKLMEEVETAPSPVITPSKPQPKISPISPPRPVKNPEPKNYIGLLKKIIDRYNTLKEEKEVETAPVITPAEPKPKINPIAPPRPVKDPEPKNFVKKFEEYEFDKSDDDTDHDVSIHWLYSDYAEIETKESRIEKDKLYKLAKDIVKEEFFDKSGDFNFDDIKWDLEIVRGGDVSKIKKVGYKYRKEEIKPEYKKEVDKRDVINMITQGSSKKAQQKLFDFSTSHDLDKEYGVPNELVSKYFRFMNSALASQHKFDFSTLEVPPSGISSIEWNGEIPTIVCKGTNFIILLHEMIKGLHELISYHGLSRDPDTMDYVDKKTSSWHHESEGLKWGHLLVNKFDNFYDEIENLLIREGKIFTRSKDIKLSILSEFYTLEATTFLTYCDAIFKNIGEKPYAFFRESYLKNVHSEEPEPAKNINPDLTGQEPEVIDYSTMGKSALQKELDDALDSSDFAKAEMISRYIKESKKYKK